MKREYTELERKSVPPIVLTLLLIGVSTLAFNIQPVKASGTFYYGPIYIRADGSVEPSDAPILNVENVSYTLMDNIYGSIIVERDNIIIDGASYTVQGMGSPSQGIYLIERKKCNNQGHGN